MISHVFKNYSKKKKYTKRALGVSSLEVWLAVGKKGNGPPFSHIVRCNCENVTNVREKMVNYEDAFSLYFLITMCNLFNHRFWNFLSWSSHRNLLFCLVPACLHCKILGSLSIVKVILQFIVLSSMMNCIFNCLLIFCVILPGMIIFCVDCLAHNAVYKVISCSK